MDLREVLVESSRRLTDLTIDAAMKNPELFHQAYELSFSEANPIAMRASWVVQGCCEKKPELLLPYFNEVIEKALHSKSDSVRRNFLKIFTEYFSLGQIPNMDLLVGKAFDWLPDPKQPVAVRYYSMIILEKFSDMEPDIKNELVAILENQMDEFTPGLKNKAKKIIKRIMKKK